MLLNRSFQKTRGCSLKPDQMQMLRESQEISQKYIGCFLSLLVASSFTFLVSKTPGLQHRPLLTYSSFLSSLLTHSTFLKLFQGEKNHNTVHLSTAQGVAKDRKRDPTQDSFLKWNFSGMIFSSLPVSLSPKARLQTNMTPFKHLRLYFFFKVSRAHVRRNPKKLQQLVCEKRFPLRGPHVLAKQLITNCGTEMLSGSRAGGNLVLRSLP